MVLVTHLGMAQAIFDDLGLVDDPAIDIEEDDNSEDEDFVPGGSSFK